MKLFSLGDVYVHNLFRFACDDSWGVGASAFELVAISVSFHSICTYAIVINIAHLSVQLYHGRRLIHARCNVTNGCSDFVTDRHQPECRQVRGALLVSSELHDLHVAVVSFNSCQPKTYDSMI